MTKYDQMTIAQKRECLALGEAIDKVKQFPGGSDFVVDLFLLTMKKAGLTVVDKNEYERLKKCNSER